MFKSLRLKNFRNFEEINIELKDKNIILGLNDVGKSNLLHALRWVFDKKLRLEDIHSTDFHNKNDKEPIEIVIGLDISQDEKEDVQKLKAKAHDAVTKEDSKNFYIKLKIEKRKEEGILKEFYWGDDLNGLKEIKTKGINYLILDDVFSVIYIPSHVETIKVFNEIKKEILKDIVSTEDDLKIGSEIKENFEKVNENIQKLSSVVKIEDEINDNLQLFDETYKVKITSQSVVDDLYKQLKIYTIENDYDYLYPASGDGRQKKIMYAMLHYFLGKEIKSKIPLLILEEPENHLFLTSQIDLSQTLFEDSNIKYIFCSSHSPELLYHIGIDCNLIRLYRKPNKTERITESKSAQIVKEYNELKKMYAESLSKGYFADCVLLVEGYSEKLLCDAILKAQLSRNQFQKIYVLPVLGTNFKPYRNLLMKLGIKIIVRTDNDIYKNDIHGLKRCLRLIGEEMEDDIPEYLKGIKSEGEEVLNEKKIKLCKEFSPSIERLKLEHDIYLAEIDLENDLLNALKDKKITHCLIGDEQINLQDLKSELQDKKWHNMFLFLNQNENLFSILFNDYRFEFLKEIKKCLQ
ncbi:AAA family ATPase [Acinetobacter sp. ANC 5033]|uniref:ATP-dependent nuclease n=2 Tax=Acinetobacter TaxID=469 RepID=UPI00201B7567|nr:AAA family ATPase [Acinetobacter amyesii]MCL6236851.1 AAA family ATPase [Acinetobacter amyesii]